MELSVKIYGLTKEFPREELYGLVSQIRRAGVSIISNIAEGHGAGFETAIGAVHVDGKRLCV
jgi:four helix bundle protein